MITCPQCGAQNIPGLAYCENCGSPLPAQSASTAPSTPSTPAAPAPTVTTQPDPSAIALPQPAMPVDQPLAGPDLNVPSPAAAGANLVAADQAAPAAPAAAPAAAPVPAPADASSSSAAAPPAPAPAAVGAGATLTITFPSGQVYTMQDDVVNIGRADVAQNWHPELDVIPYGGGAPDLGVSRHQARLERQDSGFVVVDMGSTNGTYLNGRPAPYNQPVQINDGDTLSFGALNTQVSIK